MSIYLQISTQFDHVLRRDNSAPLLVQNCNHSQASGDYLQEPAPDFGLGDRQEKLYPLNWFDLDTFSAYSMPASVICFCDGTEQHHAGGHGVTDYPA